MISYDALAADYAVHRAVQPGVLEELLKAIQDHGASHVLEVGCGTGNYLRAIAERSAAICQGSDPSEGMLWEARRRAPTIEFRMGRAEDLAFDAAFDLIYSVDVIHHVGDRLAFFQRAARALRPGGTVCTVTDSEDIIRRREPLARYFPETVEVELRRYPGIDLLRDEMARVGLAGIRESRVEFSHSITSSQPYRDRVFSSLLLIPATAFSRGIARMEADLARGPIPCVSRYVLLWGSRPAQCGQA